MITRNSPCWCGSNQKWKKCHYPNLSDRTQKHLAETYLKKYQILIKSPDQIKGIRKSCKLSVQILKKICAMAQAGITTLALNDYAIKLHEESGAIPAPLGYGDPPYPRAICTSLNDVICHGIPDQRPLMEGDILNIDNTCILDGYFGDCSAMVSIGKISEEKQLVIDTSYECLMQSIAILKPGILIKEIANIIEKHAAAKGCTVVNQFVGHGVGLAFHEAPQIPHHYNNVNIPLVPGMTFTIEPMINAGVLTGTIDNDHWTARTLDGKASAQWEHQLLITSDGYEILTTE